MCKNDTLAMTHLPGLVFKIHVCVFLKYYLIKSKNPNMHIFFTHELREHFVSLLSNSRWNGKGVFLDIVFQCYIGFFGSIPLIKDSRVLHLHQVSDYTRPVLDFDLWWALRG